MNNLTYWLLRGLVRLIALVPLVWVVWIGRQVGGMMYYVDKRHRVVALNNLTMVFGGEKSAAEIQAIAHENFRRLGENFASTIQTYMMPWEKLAKHIEIVGMENIFGLGSGPEKESRILALGHFGHFELYAHFAQFLTSYKMASTFRALRQPALNRLMVELRNRSGAKFYERRTDGAELLSKFTRNGWMLGLLADQHAGDKGLRIPFLGHECSVSTAPAVFGLRYRCQLHVAICFRVGLAKWRLENNIEIPICENGRRRSIEAVTRDINRAFEVAVRRDPANWFWVHKRWKPAPPKI